MTTTRFAPWLVFACIGTLVGCTSGDQGPAGNTELNVVIPRGSDQSGPGAFDIQVVEYTIACNDGQDFDPTSDPDIDSGPSLDNDVTLSGVLEVLDSANPGVTTQDFGPDLGEVYIAQGFMDLPPTVGCSVQLRARDADDEVICTSTETFDIAADNLTTVNVLMFCGISYQAPVGMLDLNGDFSFNVANYCPDIFVLNCIDSELNVRSIPGVGDVLATACQVRFRDADSQCGDSCDPQDCVTTPTGLDCATRPGFEDPEVSTVVVCSSTSGACAISCDGVNPAASCSFTGDTLGDIGGAAPRPGIPGPGGFFVSCATTTDASGDTVPVAPGDNITCTAQVDDGDTDCRKTKVVDLTVEGLSACQEFDIAACDDSNVCTDASCNDATCDGSVANCCVNTAVPGRGCTATGNIAGVCNANGGCDPTGCQGDDANCDLDGNVCTVPPAGSCQPDGSCLDEVPGNAGVSCNGGAGTCGATDGDDAGTCVDNCRGVVCDDGNPCTNDPACVSVGGPTCPPPVNDDTNSCTTCPSGAPCSCVSGVCEDFRLGPFSNANTCQNNVEDTCSDGNPAPDDFCNCDYGCVALGNTFGFEAILIVDPPESAVGGATVDLVFDGEFVVSEAFIAGAEIALGADLNTAVVGASPNSLPVTALSGATGEDTIVTVPTGLELDLDLDPDGNTIAGPFPLPFVTTAGSYTLAASGDANCFNFNNAVGFNLTVTELDGGPTFIPANFACQPVEQTGVNLTNIDCTSDADCEAFGTTCNVPQLSCTAIITPQADAGEVCFDSP